ncbi:hypothetical protein [Argonema antarcticum]|uniref:hypothetical protein n=1 Tax=Argonema antarcticum TaxID=2942763 RepID=UPI002011523B|nr:hypothetical protein [Argonema antarcticum]MCL1474955.1 hypothetical protein [Argonema antarcticum A004/B2]
MTVNPVASACRSCRYYTPEGRRGGNCQQLSVPVRGSWTACSLALPPFAPSWEGVEDVLIWQKEMLMLQEVLPLEVSAPESVCTSNPKKANVEALTV